MNKWQTVDFVKLDAEGAELQIMEGGKDLFERIRPTVLCEIADIRTQSFGYPARKIYEFLESRDYNWFEPDKYGSLTPVPKRDRYMPNWANLVAVPEEKMSKLAGFVGPSGRASIHARPQSVASTS